MKQLTQDLIKVKELLTKETWIKKSYFKEKDNQLCMCGHGAAQAVVNPSVAKIVKDYQKNNPSSAATAAARAAADACPAALAGELAGDAGAALVAALAVRESGGGRI